MLPPTTRPQFHVRMFARWSSNMITVWLLGSTPTERSFDSNPQRGFARRVSRVLPRPECNGFRRGSDRREHPIVLVVLGQ
jgi:hypothetical protein